MGLRASKEQIARGRARLIRDFKKRLANFFEPLTWFEDENGAQVCVINGVRVCLDFKVIYASNGETAGWPIAKVSAAGKLSAFLDPPWLNGCTVDNVAAAVKNFQSGV